MGQSLIFCKKEVYLHRKINGLREGGDVKSPIFIVKKWM